MKGIILAGGTGSRLWPSTISVSKQLLPVYDKPLIFYPLATLMLAGIRDILIITTPGDQAAFQKLLGSGQSLGISLSYEIQINPEGLAQALIIGQRFIGREAVALILGDNIFHGSGLGRDLAKCTNQEGAIIFGYQVANPHSYGVAEVDTQGSVISIEEKPKSPKSNLAIPGLYFFDNSVVNKSAKVQKSLRGELEITSVLEEYRSEERLRLKILPRGTAWMDCGTVDSLNDASNYIRAIEERQGYKVGSIQEIAWRNNWISNFELLKLADAHGVSSYGHYLKELVSGLES
jgi:glucose-1-phosphate thymidylyltransferase